MSDAVILVEIDVTAPAGGTTTLRFSDRAIRPMPPTDADRPNAIWDSRLQEAPAIRRALVEDMTTLTAGWGVGGLTLLNGDQALDAYRAYSWGEIRVYRWIEGQAFSAATKLIAGRAATPSMPRSARKLNRVSASFYDPRVELDQPLQVHFYAGVGTYEGSAEMKGRAKPLAYGDLTDAHIPAPKVNIAAATHQLHDGAINSLTGIFDRGDAAGLVSDGDKVGATFDAWAPAAAHYATDKGRGLVKMNTAPVGTVTFGLTGEAGPYVSTAGPILERLLGRLGVAAGRIGASVSALASTYTVGVFDQSGGQGRELAGWLARSVPAALLPGRDGVWTAAKLAPPKGVADFTVGQYDVIDLVEDESVAVPAGVIRVGWGRIWQTFRAEDVAPAIKGTAAATRLETEYRYAQVEDAGAKARGAGGWRTLQIETALRTEADALTLAGDLKTLFGLRPDGAPRAQWTVVVELTDAVLAVQLGATVRLVYPPRGIDDRFVLVAEEPLRPGRDRTTWTLWG